jgi:hypothetical protein
MLRGVCDIFHCPVWWKIHEKNGTKKIDKKVENFDLKRL